MEINSTILVGSRGEVRRAIGARALRILLDALERTFTVLGCALARQTKGISIGRRTSKATVEVSTLEPPSFPLITDCRVETDELFVFRL